MEKGEAAQYKGKKLDEIDLDLNVDPALSDSDGDETEPLSSDPNIATVSSLPKLSDDLLVSTPSDIDFVKPASERSKSSKRPLVAWTDERKKVTRTFFANHIRIVFPLKSMNVWT
ncbi:hypothetical protein QE152_g35791 [Popillia japonica]|uniref:Uncharacterized protein n=1 Tax=Popillia japonica TaxID=7064 RepID=A0AAW1IEW1_POPJA